MFVLFVYVYGPDVWILLALGNQQHFIVFYFCFEYLKRSRIKAPVASLTHFLDTTTLDNKIDDAVLRVRNFH